jgi:hypothetical protein
MDTRRHISASNMPPSVHYTPKACITGRKIWVWAPSIFLYHAPIGAAVHALSTLWSLLYPCLKLLSSLLICGGEDMSCSLTHCPMHCFRKHGFCVRRIF